MKGARFESKEAVWAAADKDQVLFVRRRSLSLTRRASLHSLLPSLPPSLPQNRQYSRGKNNNNKRIACYCACNKARTQAAARCAGGCSYFFVAELQGAYWVVTQFGGVGGPRCSRPIPEKQNPHQN